MANSNFKSMSNYFYYFLTLCLHLLLKVSLHVHLLQLRSRMTHMCTRDLAPNLGKETGRCQTKGTKQHFSMYAGSIERPRFDGYSSVALTDADENEAIAIAIVLLMWSCCSYFRFGGLDFMEPHTAS